MGVKVEGGPEGRPASALIRLARDSRSVIEGSGRPSVLGVGEVRVRSVVGLPEMGVVEQATQLPALPPGWMPDGGPGGGDHGPVAGDATWPAA